MSRRIEIELTSQRNETEWTWRAAGAKQPKGVLEASVLYEGAKVGHIVRAEADFEIDGITITAVLPPQAKRQDPARVAIIGPSHEFKAVTSELVAKGDKRGRGRPERSGDRGDRPDRGARSSGIERPDHKSSGGPPRGEQREREGHGRRPDRPDRSQSSGRPEGGGRPAGPTARGGDRSTAQGRPGRPERPSTPTPTFKRLIPRDQHRRAVLDQLAPEHRPIAEHVLRGGIPAVRQAVDTENAKAQAEGRPEMNKAALVAMAEELLPQLKAAEWLDRAEAAKAAVNDISVRDLRAVVSGADAVARTDQARLLASELREVLDRRTNEARDQWLQDIGTCLDEDRVIRALRLSARPPDAQTKFPAELLDRLKQATEQAMSPETTPDRWVSLLEAVGTSPVRRLIDKIELPPEPGEALLEAAKQASGRIPALGRKLGIRMPPPPSRPAKPLPKPQPPADLKLEPAVEQQDGSQKIQGDALETLAVSEEPRSPAMEPAVEPAVIDPEAPEQAAPQVAAPPAPDASPEGEQ